MCDSIGQCNVDDKNIMLMTVSVKISDLVINTNGLKYSSPTSKKAVGWSNEDQSVGDNNNQRCQQNKKLLLSSTCHQQWLLVCILLNR